ncbi:MAG: RsbRD N-terminal domain-containing protein [Planctomycetota bacterium]
MMMLKSLLNEKKSSIVDRWLGHIRATYAPETAAFLNGNKDRFANPVGHALRTGTAAIFDDLLNGMDPEAVCRHLEGIIKIRAVQDFTPSQAVSFVFLLKKAVRAELGEEAESSRLAAELTEFDAQVDQVALFAFDIFARCREQVYALRVNEANRSVAAVMKRFNCAGDPRGGGL